MKAMLGTKLLTAAIALGLGQMAYAFDCNNDGVQDVPNRPCPATAPPSGIANVPFDLLPPGARALGIGGAFTAIADDATAAEANPAGLTNLTRPELSIHGRSTDFQVKAYTGDAYYADSYNGQPGVPPAFDRLHDRNSAVSFASYVQPFDKGAVSIYYLNTTKAKASTDTTAIDNDSFDLFANHNSFDVKIEAIGLAGAYRLDDFVTVGGALRYSRLDVKATSASVLDYFFDFEQRPGANAATITDRFIAARAVDDSDRDLTFNLGVLLNPGGKWSAGIVYKDGGSYDLNTLNFTQFTLIVPQLNINNVGAPQVTPGRSRIELPDVLNVGLVYRPSDTWTVALDMHRTRFGKLPDLPGISAIFGLPAPGAQGPGNRVHLGDETSWHLGAERVFVFDQPVMGMQTLALRGGVFTDPRKGGYAGTGAVSGEPHYTVGIGGNFGEHVQIDLAGEFSPDTDNVVLSGIYRF